MLSKTSQTQKASTVWSCLYEVQEQATLTSSEISQNSDRLWSTGQLEIYWEGHRELPRVIALFYDGICVT